MPTFLRECLFLPQDPGLRNKIMLVVQKTTGFKKDPKRPLVLALGNFDGIHLGHQNLLDYVVKRARQIKGRAAVFTFRKHPQAVLHPLHAPENLQSLEQKLKIFRLRGIEVCFLQDFDRRFSTLSAEGFVKKVLVNQLAIREICVGHNARFGHGREGDADLLRQMGPSEGFDVFQSKPVLWRGAPVSSTAVREAVHQGKFDLAAHLLGRPWSVSGVVCKGEARGKKLGFPTANITLNEYAQPSLGVYAVRGAFFAASEKSSRVNRYDGVVNFGNRPTFSEKIQPVLEVHLFNFKKNIYGKKIEVFFVKRLRDEKKFASAEELKKQILKDIQSSKLALKKKQK